MRGHVNGQSNAIPRHGKHRRRDVRAARPDRLGYVQMSAAHPHAHILAQLAEIAKTNDKPWKRLETKDVNGDWVDCNFYASLLCPEAVFRIKPTTVKLGGVELEGPLREAPEENTRLWILFDHTPTPDASFLFTRRQPGHTQWLNQGRLFASKGARDRYQAALGKLAMGETK